MRYIDASAHNSANAIVTPPSDESRTAIEEADLFLRQVARRLDRAARHGANVGEAVQSLLFLQQRLTELRCGVGED